MEMPTGALGAMAAVAESFPWAPTLAERPGCKAGSGPLPESLTDKEKGELGRLWPRLERSIARRPDLQGRGLEFVDEILSFAQLKAVEAAIAYRDAENLNFDAFIRTYVDVAIRGELKTRGARKARQVDLPEGLDGLPAPSSGVEWVEFMDALDALPDHCRDLAKSYWIDGLTQAEVADLYAMGPDAVYRRLKLAKDLFRRLLDGENISGKIKLPLRNSGS